MKTVYLDQNKWVEIARFLTKGSKLQEDLTEAIDFMLSVGRAGTACFPLSFAHYVETQKRGDARSRRELAALMLEWSGCRTIANGKLILDHELDAALSRAFPNHVHQQDVPPLKLLGWGVSNAAIDYPEFDMPLVRHVLTVCGLPPDQVDSLVRKRIEFAALTYEGNVDHSTIQQKFAHGLSELRDRRPRALEGMLYARAIEDIIEPLAAALQRHNISEQFKQLEWQGLRAFFQDLPSVRIAIHLHRQWAKNKSLKIGPNDGNDLAFLGTAAMYCDVVVTEKQFADLVQRDGFTPHARILTNLRDLPEALVSLN